MEIGSVSADHLCVFRTAAASIDSTAHALLGALREGIVRHQGSSQRA
jgi:hypothetical protein